ncbi:MAG TPA: rhomboid family intramembrane serine protease [Flavobacterium sp.]|jgi:membrane associated rhomboid family serine protease|uniref:rhomboid family intramembrane serine protease n=1 Tax=Flavobacterium sp. TaxID=239 RepID=UPI002D18260A|nr:rhomboid family intramembrane serine protease [Bacteroidota bacterium]HPW98197.1 rhomboid family intramembrane serine protease [Flavobacterium sp.]
MENMFLYGLIAVNAIVSFKGFEDQFFFRKYQFHMGSIRAGEQYRVVTSGFLHADIGHLAFNMITLYFFAPIVSQSLGDFSFLLIYFASLVCGSLLTMVFHGNEYSYSAVGASGAVTGILYSAILMYPQMTIGIFGIIPMPAYIFGIGYLLYSIYGMRAKNDNIGHTAHFGGAIGGYVITLLKVPTLFQDNLLMVILLAVPIVLLFILAKAGKL